MDPGFFGRIARHPRRLDRDEAEDRLTEVFAAVAAHSECQGLETFVVCGWLEDALAHSTPGRAGLEALLVELTRNDSELVAVSTQVQILAGGRRRRPDLELVFSTPSGEVVIWVEVKHGTAPHSGQLADYVLALAQQERRIARGAVLLVAPRADCPSFPAAEIPETVPTLTWQRTALRLRAYAPPGPVAAFLIDELCDYMREEQLMDPSLMTPEHFSAFEFHADAFAALEPICAVADAAVARQWQPPDDPNYHDTYGSDPHRSYS